MMPDHVLSSQTFEAPLILADPQPSKLLSKERGGVALNDPSQGLDVKTWYCTVEGDWIVVWNDDIAPIPIISGIGVTEVSLAFDQNMRPFIAFVQLGVAKFYWFDTSISQPVITNLPTGSISPRATLDDHRQTQNSASDIILVYIWDGTLYFRAQRDRYLVAYPLYPDINLVLINPRVHYVAMNIKWRLQIGLLGSFYGQN